MQIFNNKQQQQQYIHKPITVYEITRYLIFSHTNNIQEVAENFELIN